METVERTTPLKEIDVADYKKSKECAIKRKYVAILCKYCLLTGIVIIGIILTALPDKKLMAAIFYGAAFGIGFFTIAYGIIVKRKSIKNRNICHVYRGEAVLLNVCDSQNEMIVNKNGKMTKIIYNAPIKKGIVNDSKVIVIIEDDKKVEVDNLSS